MCSRHTYMFEWPLKHHWGGDSYLIRVAPVDKASIVTHPREKGGNEILHLDYSIKTKHWACCTYIVLSCKYFQVIRQYSFFFMNPKWIVMTENRPQRQQRAWKTIAILMNAKCAISQELRAALKHGVSLVSTSVHLGSFSFDSFVPVCRFIGRACYWWLWWRSSPPSWLTGVTVM